MAFRFFRRMKIAPGVSLNLSKSGPSLSFGPRGAKYTVGPRGTRRTIGLPGTGLHYTTASGFGAKGHAPDDKHTYDLPDPSACKAPPVPRMCQLNLGFFKRLFTPDDEKAFVDGCRELALGDNRKAREHFQSAPHIADVAYLAGFLAMQENRLADAERHLVEAAKRHKALGTYLRKYGIASTMHFPVTPEVIAHAEPNLRSVLLALTEVYQAQDRWQEAMDALQRLRRLDPDDVVVKLSLAELLLDAKPGDKRILKKVVEIAGAVENETPVHAALMLYKARALRALGLADAARETLTPAIRRTKGRGKELLCSLRYERGLTYETLGKKSQARKDFERIYAESPQFEDVAERLCL